MRRDQRRSFFLPSSPHGQQAAYEKKRVYLQYLVRARRPLLDARVDDEAGDDQALGVLFYGGLEKEVGVGGWG